MKFMLSHVSVPIKISGTPNITFRGILLRDRKANYKTMTSNKGQINSNVAEKFFLFWSRTIFYALPTGFSAG